jgi:hypothetical protein
LIAVNPIPLFTSVPVDDRDQNPPTDHTAFGMRRSKIIKKYVAKREDRNERNYLYYVLPINFCTDKNL